LDNNFTNLVKKNEKTFGRGLYQTNPSFKIEKGKIKKGYKDLFSIFCKNYKEGSRVFLIDGFNGSDWIIFKKSLDELFSKNDLKVVWENIDKYLLPEKNITEKIKPFLGAKDPLWGTHYPFGMESFFDPIAISNLRIKSAKNKNKQRFYIIYGCGAGVLDIYDCLIYVDIPKDFIQERARTNNVKNIGLKRSSDFSKFYKQSYFIDWPAQNRKKKELLPHIDYLIDLRDQNTPATIKGSDFRSALSLIAETPFRPRPWFYPGPWGGKFMQGHMGLDPRQPNFAWSFELIAPENGIVIKSDDKILEFSFDFIMFQENKKMLGEMAAKRFQYEWPIRMDYLDTINGGNLSTQCHPRPEFMIDNFGETYTQDETYYISVAKENAKVFVGLKEDEDPLEFKHKLLQSEQNGIKVDIEKYVHSVKVKPHDLILIPNGTVHCSGEGNLVLEISATPYIFTFKIYDYLRKDLNGNLRKLNIERAFQNIRQERTSSFIDKNFTPKPKLIDEGSDWKNFEIYNRIESFYNINRIDFLTKYELDTEGNGLIINLVEGRSIFLTSKNGIKKRLNLFETMVIPAASGLVKLSNQTKHDCKLVYSFVRPSSLKLGLNDPQT
tara:strand:+ start:6149 stop:7972 length:1824 start_codon:yes stop_codon:yes gene_type:complete